MTQPQIQAAKGAALAAVALLVALGVIPGTQADAVKAFAVTLVTLVAVAVVPPHKVSS